MRRTAAGFSGTGPHDGSRASTARAAARRWGSWWTDWDVTTVRDRPQPHVEIASGVSVPAWLLRVLLAGVALTCGSLVVDHPVQRAAVAGAAIGLACAPRGALPALLIGLAVFGYARNSPDPGIASALLLGLHLVQQLARFVAGLGWSARIELRAIAGAGWPFLAIQAFAQALGLGALALASRSAAGTWAAVAAGALLAACVWFATRTLSRQSAP